MVRKTLIISYAVLIIAFAAPFAYRYFQTCRSEQAPEPQAKSAEAEKERAETVSVLCQGEVLSLDMHSYLVGVVAAEMPASFPGEALKAQAVAARTYTAYCSAMGRHAQAQICSFSGCCQAWMSDEQLYERWGADYEKYRAVVEDAVTSTAGEYLSFEGQPVFAAFHSSSAGATESSAQIWNHTPYLVSVYTPETPENLPQLISQVKVAALDFRDAILSEYPQAELSAAPEYWLGELQKSLSGRVDTLGIGGTAVPGTKLRQLFSLRSTAFDVSFDGRDFVFTVAGYGHGVGMSQYGAKIMAEQGSVYTAILAHYYPGTSLVSFS